MNTVDSNDLSGALAPIMGLGRWWLATRTNTQLAFLCSFLFLKNGVTLLVENARVVYIPSALNLPNPPGYLTTSVGNLALARVTAAFSVKEWMVLHEILVLLVLCLGALLASRQTYLPQPVLMLVLFSSTAFSTLSSTIGIYDPVTLLGALSFTLARSRILIFIGAGIMALGNAEQAVLASISLLLLSTIPSFGEWRLRASIGVGTTVLLFLVLQLWILSSRASACFPGCTRFETLEEYLPLSLSNFLVAPTFALWSWYGVSWFIVSCIIAASIKRRRTLLVLSLVAIPGLATLSTADGARVFGLISFPSIVAASLWFWRQIQNSPTQFELYIGLFLILWITIPSNGGGSGQLGEDIAEWIIGTVATVLSVP